MQIPISTQNKYSCSNFLFFSHPTMRLAWKNYFETKPSLSPDCIPFQTFSQLGIHSTLDAPEVENIFDASETLSLQLLLFPFLGFTHLCLPALTAFLSLPSIC
eukprot:Sdes_comp15907_c0_seq1m5031